MLEALSAEQASDLRKKMQDLHGNLTPMLRLCQHCPASCNPLSRSALKGIDASTEDIGDIIEDLALSESGQFRALLKDSVRAIADPAARLGGM